MFDIFQILISLFAFLLAIGILVAFHEYGHFWMARKLGVQVLRFSVGLGKPLWRKQLKSGTEFVLAAIPLGGYVKMLDGNEQPLTDAQKPYAFNEQSVYKRFAIVLAGPVFNFIFAILAYWLIFTVGVEQKIPIIGTVTPQSIAADAGLETGQEIVKVGEQQTRNWSAVVREIVPYIGEEGTLDITTYQDGQSTLHQLDLSSWEIEGRQADLFESLGLKPFYPPLEPIIDKVLDSEPAQIAGFEPGDKVLAVNDEPLEDWNVFVEKIYANALKPMLVTVLRDGQLLNLEVTPRVRSYLNDPDKGYLGLTVKIPKKLSRQDIRVERWGVLTSLGMAFEKTWAYIKMTYVVLGKMILGDIGLDNLSGPITIAKGAGASASGGFVYYVGFLAIISISLGVLNLLPIPILDGGHLVYYVVEMITGKPVSLKIQLAGYKFGLFLIIFLMTIAFYNDIIRMF